MAKSKLSPDYIEWVLKLNADQAAREMHKLTEATPFEKFSKGRFTILVFYVNGHMFCYFNIDDFSEITIKCDPSRIAELKATHEAVVDPYNGNKKHWIGVKLGMDMNDAQILQLVKDSYLLVKGG